MRMPQQLVRRLASLTPRRFGPLGSGCGRGGGVRRGSCRIFGAGRLLVMKSPPARRDGLCPSARPWAKPTPPAVGSGGWVISYAQPRFLFAPRLDAPVPRLLRHAELPQLPQGHAETLDRKAVELVGAPRWIQARHVRAAIRLDRSRENRVRSVTVLIDYGGHRMVLRW